MSKFSEMRANRERDLCARAQPQIVIFGRKLKNDFPLLKPSLELLSLVGVDAVDTALQMMPNRMYSAVQNDLLSALMEQVGKGVMIDFCQNGRRLADTEPSGQVFTRAKLALDSAATRIGVYSKGLMGAPAFIDLEKVNRRGLQAASRCMTHVPDCIIEYVAPGTLGCALAEVGNKAQYEYLERQIFRGLRASGLRPDAPKEPI